MRSSPQTTEPSLDEMCERSLRLPKTLNQKHVWNGQGSEADEDRL